MLKLINSSAFSTFRSAIIVLSLITLAGSFAIYLITGDAQFISLSILTAVAGGAFALLSSKSLINVFSK